MISKKADSSSCLMKIMGSGAFTPHFQEGVHFPSTSRKVKSEQHTYTRLAKSAPIFQGQFLLVHPRRPSPEGVPVHGAGGGTSTESHMNLRQLDPLPGTKKSLEVSQSKRPDMSESPSRDAQHCIHSRSGSLVPNPPDLSSLL